MGVTPAPAAASLTGLIGEGEISAVVAAPAPLHRPPDSCSAAADQADSNGVSRVQLAGCHARSHPDAFTEICKREFKQRRAERLQKNISQ